MQFSIYLVFSPHPHLSRTASGVTWRVLTVVRLRLSLGQRFAAAAAAAAWLAVAVVLVVVLVVAVVVEIRVQVKELWEEVHER